MHQGRTSVHHLLEDHAAARAGAIAILAPGRSPLSYGRLWRQVSETTALLHRRGIGEHDRVALVLSNGPEMATAFLSVSATAACAPLNPAYRPEEFDRVLRDLSPRALIVRANVASPARTAGTTLGIPVIELSSIAEEPAGIFSLDIPDLGAARSTAGASAASGALLLHTSGTTAKPTLVPLTHGNLWHSARNITEALDLRPRDRCLNVMPLFHVHGLVGALVASVAAGGSIVCAPDFVAPEFFAWLDEFEPTWYTAVPAIHAAIVARAASHRASIARSRLRFVRSSSAPLPPALMADLEGLFGVPAIEAYGMTEAAHQIASNPLPPRARKPGSVGIAAGPDVAVLDDLGHPLGADREGDIVIRGPNVVADGWLKTGDRGRIDADGYVFLSGRTKEIINRGGEKISPREVEDVLLMHAGVADAVCFAAPDARLGEDVAAAVVRRECAAVTALDLRDFASTRLADFKVPSRIAFVDEIPTGPTGKAQRVGMASRLGMSAAAGVAVLEPPTAPRRATERLLCEVWSELLGVGDVGVHDDFFALGGDSIMATQILSRVHAATGAEMSMARFLDAPTVAEMAPRLSPMVEAADAASAAATIPATPRTATRPLSHTQQSIWILSQLDPQSPIYNVSMALRLDGPLDVAALERSLNDIVRRHDVLRTTFPVQEGAPVQAIAPALELSLELADRAEPDRPFDLGAGPLIRACLVRLDPDAHLLHIDLHHIVADAWSRRILAAELVAGYDACARGGTVALGDPRWQFADFAEWERRSLTPDVVASSVAFWKSQLAGAADRLPLPVATVAPSAGDPQQLTESIALPGPLVERLRSFSRSQRVSLFMTLAGAFQILLHRLTDEHDIVIGVPVAGRRRPEVEQSIGCFVNAVVLRTDLSGNPTFTALLDRVREASLKAYAHQDLPFPLLVDALGAPKSPACTPWFNVMFDFVDHTYAPAAGGGVTFTPVDFAAQMPAVDLLLYVKQHGDGLSAWLHYRPATFVPAHAADLLRRFRSLLEHAIDQPDAPIGSFSTPAALPEAERRRLLIEWNDTTREYPRLPVHRLIEQQVARTPDAVAVACEGDHLTYRELNRRANGLASHLRELGVGPDVLVGLCVERSLDMMVALVAILKAGGAYVPLDPAYPPARLSFMIDDAQPAVLLTQQHLGARVPASGARVVCVDACEVRAMVRDENLELEVSDDRLAYVIYTSGSTGQPKGAMNEHRGVANRLLWGQETLQLRPSDRVLQKTPISFDVSVEELFGPLIAGARLILARPDGHKDHAYLSRLIRSEGITTIHFVPPVLDVFLDEPDVSQCTSLRYVITSGEALRPEVQAKCFERLRAQLFNLYGPTETAVEVTSWRCQPSAADGIVPIGRPIANARIYILDRQRHPVPVGVPGELHIGGVPVGRGYWRQPALTALAFLPDPFVDQPGARMYASGDLARYRADGQIEFLGRIDHQMKIRGLRIEPAEIEAALVAHPAVERCLVMAGRSPRRDQLLTAYVVARAGAPVTPAALRAFAQSTLPQELIPAAFVMLDALPLTPNGKVDRRALPAPEPFRDTRGFVAPRDPIERELVAIWEEILGIDSIGATDNFFDLGGHSLAAIRVFDRMTTRVGATVPASALFQAPTVEQLAALIRARAEPDDTSLVPIQPFGSNTPLFCIHGLGGSVLAFRNLSAALGNDQPLYGLQALGIDGRHPAHLRIEDMAEHYTGEIRRVQSVGPYRLAGWSMGGAIALEIARRLRASGEDVTMLAFLDAPALGRPTMLPRVESLRYRYLGLARVAKKNARLLRAQKWMDRPRRLREIVKAWAEGIRVDRAYRQRRRHGEAVRLHTSNVRIAQYLALRRYRPAPFDGSAILFRTKASRDTSRRGGTLGWGHLLTGELAIYDVPGEHLTLLSPPHVQILADYLKRHLPQPTAIKTRARTA